MKESYDSPITNQVTFKIINTTTHYHTKTKDNKV